MPGCGGCSAKLGNGNATPATPTPGGTGNQSAGAHIPFPTSNCDCGRVPWWLVPLTAFVTLVIGMLIRKRGA